MRHLYTGGAVTLSWLADERTMAAMASAAATRRRSSLLGTSVADISRPE